MHHQLITKIKFKIIPGADTSVVEAAFLASQDLQESSSLDQTESPDDQKDSGK